MSVDTVTAAAVLRRLGHVARDCERTAAAGQLCIDDAPLFRLAETLDRYPEAPVVRP